MSGNPIPGNNIDAPEDIKSYFIKNKIVSADSVIALIDLELAENSEAQVEIHYYRSGDGLEVDHRKEIYITKDVAVPTDHYAQFCAIPNCSWSTRDDSKMTWKTSEYSKEYNTGEDVGAVTLPASECYLLKSREGGPLMIRFVFRPRN